MASVPELRSLQEEHFSQGTCFGCGPKNPLGLQLRSFCREDQVEAHWTSAAQHGNGLGFLNGGILSTLLDCQAAAAVMRWCAEHYGAYHFSLEKMEEATHPLFVTSALEVRFLRPVPLQRRIQILARIHSIDERRAHIHSRIFLEGQLCAEAKVSWRPLRRR